MAARIHNALKAQFRPEFLNRVDEIIIFNRLQLADIKGIVDIQASGLKKRLKERQIGLELTERLKKWLAHKGYDPVYGARPLKRVIQKFVQDPLAIKMLRGQISAKQHVIADVDKDGQVVSKVTAG